MPGLYLSACDAADHAALIRLLHDFDLPLAAFVQEAPALSPELPRPAFLRAASIAALRGQPLPAQALLTHFANGDPLPANVIRRHLFLRQSLLPYLKPGRTLQPLTGCFLLGDDLLIAPVSASDTVDALLPPGVWTELNGAVHSGFLRCMRGYNETPVLMRPNALLPVSMNGQSLTQTAADDTDRLTLHWFQPDKEAICTLAGGIFYRVSEKDGDVRVDTNATKPFHLILHRDGTETFVR